MIYKLIIFNVKFSKITVKGWNTVTLQKVANINILKLKFDLVKLEFSGKFKTNISMGESPLSQILLLIEVIK